MTPGGQRPPLWSLLLEGEDYTARLVVDSLVQRTSSGGLRIAPDVSELEVKTLAREMSHKYAFFNLSRGGAKMAVSMGAAGRDRERILLEVGRRLGPLIWNRLYYPGMDMGCSEEDLRCVYRGAGIELGSITDTSFFTALTVRDTLLPCSERLGGDSSRPLTLAIAGLGRVATHLLRLLPETFRVVAFSTVEGGRHVEDGIPCVELAEERARHGDAVVERMTKGRAIPAGEVLEAPVDILVPSARTRDVDTGNEEAVRARAIVPIANAPVSDAAAQRLAARGILYVPGFVANAGGVYASGLFDRGIPIPEIDALCVHHHRGVVEALLAAASARGTAPDILARRLAEQHLEGAGAGAPPPTASRIVEALKGRLSRDTSPAAARKRFVATMDHLVAELGRMGPA